MDDKSMTETSMSTLFPMFLELAGRQVLVVGAGKIGEGKIAGLLDTGARIRVVAREASAAVREWARTGQLELDLRSFAPSDLDDVFIAVVATASRDLNEFVYREAQSRRVLCNVVDVPEFCDFFYPAVVRRGDLQIAISTSGQSPALAQKLRQQLEQQFGPAYAAWVAELGETRKLVQGSDLPAERKRELLLSLASREALEAAVQAAQNETQALAATAGAAAKGERA